MGRNLDELDLKFGCLLLILFGRKEGSVHLGFSIVPNVLEVILPVFVGIYSFLIHCLNLSNLPIECQKGCLDIVYAGRLFQEIQKYWLCSVLYYVFGKEMEEVYRSKHKFLIIIISYYLTFFNCLVE